MIFCLSVKDEVRVFNVSGFRDSAIEFSLPRGGGSSGSRLNHPIWKFAVMALLRVLVGTKLKRLHHDDDDSLVSILLLLQLELAETPSTLYWAQ
jgi:hypothetical protein